MIPAHACNEPPIVTNTINSLDLRAQLHGGPALVVNRPDYTRALGLEDGPLRHELLSTQFWLLPSEGEFLQPSNRCVRICNPFSGSGPDILVLGFGMMNSFLPMDQTIIWYTSPEVLEKKIELQGKAKLFSELLADILNYLHDGIQPL